MELERKKWWSTEKRRDTIRLAGIATFNGLLTVFTGFQSLGNIESTSAGPLLVETAHDVGDTAVTSARAVALQTSSHEKTWFKKFRRVTYLCVSSLAVAAVVKSGHELYGVVNDVVDNGFSLNDISDNVDRVVNGAVIGFGNEASFLVSQTLEGRNDIVHDAKHHSKVDRDTSLILAAGITAGAVLPFVAEITGVGTGVYTAWHMRPTENNLNNHEH